MTTYPEVYTWLNREQNSHLTNRSRFSIWEINDQKLPESQKDARIETLVNSTRSGPDDFEYPETLVFAGKTQAERGKLSEGKHYLELAASRYTALNDPFRGAVARWMLSMAEWQMVENNAAHANARAARDAFDRIATERRQELQEKKRLQPELQERVRWFGDRINQLNDDLIEKPEEAFTWLNRFEESYLTPPVKQLRSAIFRRMTNRDFYRVYDRLREMQDLVRVGLEPSERAEVFAFSGLIYHQLGNSKEAEKSFRLSTSLFPPDRHHHAVVRWMQAMVELQDALRRSEAIRMCSECVNCFEKLRLDADYRNRKGECFWYETQANTLRRAVTRLVETDFS